ncbi:MAG TPA: NosD domain-containing protein, partial [Candidatus Sumerlaeota bacterium]|nr:NosD domain-containing protein [Candidatus Sumerlaeota bacterium]
KTAIGAHADIADAHHIWPLTDAEIPDDITIDDSGSISAKAINSSTIGEAYISSAIARDSELAYDAVVAPSGGDYTTLQAALAANKKTILVRNGTYTLDSDIEITQSGTVIIGESRDGVIFDCNNTAFGIKAEYYGLSGGGTITIPNGGSTVTGTGTSWVTQLSDISRAYIRLGDVWYKIASIPNNTTINLTDTYRGKELSLATYASGNILKNIRLENLTIANFNSSNKGAISFSGAVDGIIKNSAANKCTDYGFRFQNSSNCQIRNNFLMSNRTAGIYIEYSRHINLSGNLCQNSTMNGILLLQSRKCTINNNHCSNNNYNGIGFDSSSYNNLTGNECVGNSRGILMDDSHYNVINANQFIDNSESGLWLTSNDDRNTIVGNTSMDNGQYGIDIQNANCSSNIVGMNTLYNNTLGAGNDLGTGTQQKTTNYPTF